MAARPRSRCTARRSSPAASPARASAGGWMVDWLAIPTVAAGAHAVALAGNVALTLWPGPWMAVLALALVGLGYGLISGVTAAAVAVYWSRALYGRVAGRLYLAWCAAAVVLPIVAGRLFDLTHGLWNRGAHRRRRQCAGRAGGARASPPGQVAIRVTRSLDRARGGDGWRNGISSLTFTPSSHRGKTLRSRDRTCLPTRTLPSFGEGLPETQRTLRHQQLRFRTFLARDTMLVVRRSRRARVLAKADITSRLLKRQACPVQAGHGCQLT